VQRYVYAFADGTSFTVIYNGKGCKMPVLAVVSIAETGERDVLAFCVADRENEQVCNDLLADLKARGVKAIDLWISDGNKEVVSSCFMWSFAVCTFTNSPYPLLRPGRRAPKFYTAVDKLPPVLKLVAPTSHQPVQGSQDALTHLGIPRSALPLLHG
jgi:Transposase, Mutator family